MKGHIQIVKNKSRDKKDDKIDLFFLYVHDKSWSLESSIKWVYERLHWLHSGD